MADEGRRTGRIRVAPELDPASPAVAHEGEALTNVLSAPGYDRLQRDLRAYADGRIGGRSYLISGHRGAGKTTLVIAAIQEVRAERARTQRKRPLLVRLAAPKLLRVRPGAPAAGMDGATVGDPAAGASVDATTEQVLRGITVGLFHALVEEYASAYTRGVRRREAANLLSDSARRRPPTGPGSAADLEELGAHLGVLVSQGPTLAELRDLWQRSGLLGEGVLGCHGPEVVGQAGVREVAVLWEALQVWQRVVGTRTLSNTQTDNRNNTSTQTATFNVDPRQLTNALVGLAVGAGVGFSWDTPVGVLVGAALSVLTFKTLDFTDVTTRTRTRDLQQVYTEHTGIGSVARLLPRLVETLRELGLAPVFVIDELDKVDKVEVRLAELLGDLKQLVAEEAFFCFLTDRSYYEHVHRALAFEALPVEQTWFTERLYVHFTPGPLRRWVRRSLLVEGAEAERDRAEVSNDLDLWVPVLLFRARLHAHTLRRELARLCDADGVFRAPPGKVRTDAEYRFAVFYQLAVEHVLAQPALARWMEDEPYNAQLATDALYWPARVLAAGGQGFVATEDALLAYYDARTLQAAPPSGRASPDTAEPRAGESDLAVLGAVIAQSPVVSDADAGEPLAEDTANTQGTAEAGGAAAAPASPPLPSRSQPVRRAELKLLVETVRRLAEMLAEPARLVSLFAAGATRREPLTAAERGAIELFAAQWPDGVLAREAAPCAWRWIVERFDPVLPGGGEDTIPDVDSVEALVDAVSQSVSALLPELTLADLAEQYDILNTSPPYRELQRARKVLRDRAVPREEKAQARGTIMAYGHTLREALPRLRMLLAGVRVLRRSEGWQGVPPSALLQALRADSQGPRAAIEALFADLIDDVHPLQDLDGWIAAAKSAGATATPWAAPAVVPLPSSPEALVAVLRQHSHH